VTRLRLDQTDTNVVLADIQVVSDTPVDTKSYARLEPLGLTGLSYIQIFSGGEEFPLLNELPGRGPKRIEGQMSQLDTFLDGGGSVIESATIALKRVNSVLSAEAVLDFHTSDFDINKFNAMMASIAEAADSITETANSITNTSTVL